MNEYSSDFKNDSEHIMLSFCLPVYNVSVFLDDCIRSIIGQHLAYKYEIICVDDCSKDDSVQMLEQIKSSYKDDILVCFKIILNEKNSGVCYSRNRAIAESKGKYIWFIDPDDMLVSDVVNSFISQAESRDADVVLGNYKRVSEELHFQDVLFNSVSIDFFEKPSSNFPLPVDDNKKYMCAIWAGLFRRNFLLDNNLRFKEGMIAQEDTLFYYEFSQYTENIYKTDSICYLYRQRNSSVMHSSSENRTKAYFESMKIMTAVYYDYFNKKNCEDIRLEKKIHHCKQNLVSTLAISKDHKYVKQQLELLKEKGWYPYRFRLECLRGPGNPVEKVMNFLLPLEPLFWIVHFIYSTAYRAKIRKHKLVSADLR